MNKNVFFGDSFGPGGHLKKLGWKPRNQLVQIVDPQIMYARGEYDTKKIVADRVLTSVPDGRTDMTKSICLHNT